jgi:signal transduction histidine kinase
LHAATDTAMHVMTESTKKHEYRIVEKNYFPHFPVQPKTGLAIAIALTLIIGLLDYTTGYGFRLSVFYLIPIAIATWVYGIRAGLMTSCAASLLWLLSFQSANFYINQVYFFWEAGVMLFGFAADTWLVSRLRNAVNRADARFMTIVEEMPLAISVSSPNQELLCANGEMTQFVDGHPEQIDRFLSRLEVVEPAHDGLSNRFNLTLVRDPVNNRWFMMHQGDIPWSSARNATLTVLTDITEKYQADELRAKNREISHHVARLTILSEVASTLAHEINQPLMAITTYTDACRRLLAQSPGVSPEVHNAIDRCHQQAVRAAAVVARLNDFIREKRPTGAPGILDQVLRDVIALCAEDCRQHHVRIRTCPLGDKRIAVDMDQVLLTQILHNLIRNAIDAMHGMPTDDRLIDVMIQTSTPTAEHVTIQISDRGHGHNPETLEQIFEPFFTTREKGLGLGLSICKSIAEAHAGCLGAESNHQGGLTFHLTLPISQSPLAHVG